MINKPLVKQRFSKSLKTYNENAIIQKKMARKLINLLPVKSFNSVFEIGCATGILTKQIAENISFETFTANDIVEKSKEYIDKIIPNNKFILGDIEEIKINKKYDLIIANAVLQWCENPQKTIDKLFSHLNNNGIIAVSIFANDNFKEIQTVLNIKPSIKTNLHGITEEYSLLFDSPKDVLKHIKATGANALTEYKFTKSSLKTFEEKYRNLYTVKEKYYNFNDVSKHSDTSLNNKVSLTYKPLYIIKKKICK